MLFFLNPNIISPAQLSVNEKMRERRENGM